MIYKIDKTNDRPAILTIGQYHIAVDNNNWVVLKNGNITNHIPPEITKELKNLPSKPTDYEPYMSSLNQKNTESLIKDLNLDDLKFIKKDGSYTKFRVKEFKAWDSPVYKLSVGDIGIQKNEFIKPSEEELVEFEPNLCINDLASILMRFFETFINRFYEVEIIKRSDRYAIIFKVDSNL